MHAGSVWIHKDETDIDHLMWLWIWQYTHLSLLFFCFLHLWRKCCTNSQSWERRTTLENHFEAKEQFTEQLQPIVRFHAILVPYNVLSSRLILSQQNRTFLLHCLKILCAYQSLKNVPCQKHWSASDSLKNHLIVLSLDSTALPASHVSQEQQGSPWWIISSARLTKLEKPFAEVLMSKGRHTKALCVFTLAKTIFTLWSVRTYTCVHMAVCVCVAHTCLCVQRKWLTVKNVTNSNFNCQWEKNRPQYLWVLSRWTEEKGLSMKAYSLSQLKSALTWLQSLEVRLAVILERSALASNNRNWMGKKKLFNRAKGKAFSSLSFPFFPRIILMLFCMEPHSLPLFFWTWN